MNDKGDRPYEQEVSLEKDCPKKSNGSRNEFVGEESLRKGLVESTTTGGMVSVLRYVDEVSRTIYFNK